MSILLVGLNHQTAPLDLRERLSLTVDQIGDALPQLNGHVALCAPLSAAEQPAYPSESMIVSTCNRFEIYVTAADPARGWAAVESFITHYHNIPLEDVRPQLYYRHGRQAVEHAMRVSAGLESMVLGETQILSQVARAYRLAQQAGTSGPILSQLFTRATHAGKRARTETAISRHSTSIGHVAALLIKAKIANLKDARILVLGAGSMAQVAARALQMQEARTFLYINRTYARAEALARLVEGRVSPWDQLPAALRWADVVVTATGATQPVIDAEIVRAVQAYRDGRPLLFVDLAVPRNIDKSVDELPDIHRYDVDDLQAVLDANLAQRQANIPAVEAIVQEEVERFQTWLHSRQVVPVITDLRSKALALANHEAQQTLRQLQQLDQRGCELVTGLAHRIINKLLHEPTVRLKVHASDEGGSSYVLAIRDLFALDAGPAARQTLAAEAVGIDGALLPRDYQRGGDDA